MPPDHDPGMLTLTYAALLVRSHDEAPVERRRELLKMYREIAQHHGEPQRLAYAMALEEIDSAGKLDVVYRAAYATPGVFRARGHMGGFNGKRH